MRSISSLVRPRDLAVTAFLRGFLAGLSVVVAAAGAGFTFMDAVDSPLFFAVLILAVVALGLVFQIDEREK